MTGDASIAGDAYPVDAPGLAPSGVHAIQTFCILELSFLWIYDFWLTLGYTTFIYKDKQVTNVNVNQSIYPHIKVVTLICASGWMLFRNED